jgi:hypothetical protein
MLRSIEPEMLRSMIARSLYSSNCKTLSSNWEESTSEKRTRALTRRGERSLEL